MKKVIPKPYIGLRILAGLIDYSIIYGITFVLIFVFEQPDGENRYVISGLPALAPIFFWLCMTVFIESGLGGTIGNSIVGLKVIPINGKNRKLSFLESLKRHLLDPIDMAIFGLVGIIMIKNSEKHQRVGDVWAKTIVVKIKDIEKNE